MCMISMSKSPKGLTKTIHEILFYNTVCTADVGTHDPMAGYFTPHPFHFDLGVAGGQFLYGLNQLNFDTAIWDFAT